MTARLSLRAKLMGAFVAVAMVTLIVGALAIWSIHRVQKDGDTLAGECVPQWTLAGRIESQQRLVGYYMVAYSYNHDPQWLAKAKAAAEPLRQAVADTERLAQDHPGLKQLGAAIREIRSALDEYERAILESEKASLAMAAAREQGRASAEAFADAMSAYLETQRAAMIRQIDNSADSLQAGVSDKAAGSREELKIRQDRINEAAEIAKAGAAIDAGLCRAMALRDVEALRSLSPQFEAIKGRLAKLLASTRQEANKRQLSTAMEEADKHLQAIQRSSDALNRGLAVAQQRLAAYNRTLGLAADLTASAQKTTNEISQRTKARLQATSATTVVGMIAGFAVAAGLGVVVSLRITRPIARIGRVLQAVVSGDYSQRVEVTSCDELGQMSQALNTAIEASAEALEAIRQSAERDRDREAQRAAEERRHAEQEQRRQAEETQRERERLAAEQSRQEQEALRERQRSEAERQAAEILNQKISRLLAVVSAAAKGDLTRDVDVAGDQPIDALAAGIRQMLADLSEVIAQVTGSAQQFAEGSRVIAENAQTLAEGAQSQSSSVEQMGAAIERLTSSIGQVKDSALQADSLAKQAAQLADSGGTAVQKSIEAMELIRTSSQQIGEIIRVISEIANQTNLLALNAAIEAARAGEHGMGFAVVADEVRKLAERSNQAAREISGLIRESAERVNEGAQLSEETGQSLRAIISGVESTAAKIGEIAGATLQQAASADEVFNVIHNVARVTEQTAAGSEEMASSSEELGSQAAMLRDLVARFSTK